VQGLQGWPEPDALPPAWEPSIEDLEGLQPPGRAFLTRVANENTIDYIQGTLLLQAARLLDAIALWRGEAATNKQAARLVIGHTKTFAALLSQAGIR
jgi:hypothetical protein